MSYAEFTWRGEEAKKIAADAGHRGLVTAGEFLLAAAKLETPHDTGDLRASGAVTVVSEEKVAVSFNTPYAVRQHEELSYRHPKGGKAKYLEDPFNANRDRLRRIVANTIRAAFGR